MANAAESEETTPQIINIGLIIITRPTVFTTDIRQWHELPLSNKTWIRFKTHFKTAQRAIIRNQPAVTTGSLGYHEQANAASVTTIVDQVIGRLQAQQNADSAIMPGSAAEILAGQQMKLQLANATQQSQTMFEPMQSLQSTIATLQNQVNNNSATTQVEAAVEEVVVADDPDAAAEAETKVEAKAEDKVEDKEKDEMVHPDLEDHQDTAGRTATACIIALGATGATTKRKAIWMPQPSPTCSAETSAHALGSEIRGHQLAS